MSFALLREATTPAFTLFACQSSCRLRKRKYSISQRCRGELVISLRRSSFYSIPACSVAHGTSPMSTFGEPTQSHGCRFEYDNLRNHANTLRYNTCRWVWTKRPISQRSWSSIYDGATRTRTIKLPAIHCCFCWLSTAMSVYIRMNGVVSSVLRYSLYCGQLAQRKNGDDGRGLFRTIGTVMRSIFPRYLTLLVFRGCNKSHCRFSRSWSKNDPANSENRILGTRLKSGECTLYF